MTDNSTAPALEPAGRPVALVTGASRGIGAATAIVLARDGYDVALAARTVEDLEKVAAQCQEHGARTVIAKTDVMIEDEVRGAVQQAAADLGRLDVLVNNAGWNSFMSPLVDMRPSGWEKFLTLNATQVFWALQEAGKIMLAQGSGSVVNVSSVAGVAGSPFMAHYGAAKAAVVNLTRTVAVEWGPSGVRVNCVAPGWVKTDINSFAWTQEESEKAFVERAPIKRWGRPEEIAEAIAFLAAEKSSYITGQTLVIDGGLGLSAF